METNLWKCEGDLDEADISVWDLIAATLALSHDSTKANLYLNQYYKSNTTHKVFWYIINFYELM